MKNYNILGAKIAKSTFFQFFHNKSFLFCFKSEWRFSWGFIAPIPPSLVHSTDLFWKSMTEAVGRKTLIVSWFHRFTKVFKNASSEIISPHYVRKRKKISIRSFFLALIHLCFAFCIWRGNISYNEDNTHWEFSWWFHSWYSARTDRWCA